MAFQPGNKFGKGRKDKPFRDALMMELKAAGENMPELRAVARGLIDRAKEQDPAARELIDRLDGKVPQAVIGDDEEPPVNVQQKIEIVIVRPDQSRGGVSSANEPGQV